MHHLRSTFVLSWRQLFNLLRDASFRPYFVGTFVACACGVSPDVWLVVLESHRSNSLLQTISHNNYRPVLRWGWARARLIPNLLVKTSYAYELPRARSEIQNKQSPKRERRSCEPDLISRMRFIPNGFVHGFGAYSSGPRPRLSGQRHLFPFIVFAPSL
jgi:hypothetical protein